MIKAIETEYNGYRFRSRLEARWAVFFDTLGIKYEYEKEGYDLDGVWYLPDFWLPEIKQFMEVKGTYPSDEDLEKVRRLNASLPINSGAVIAIGEIPKSNSDFNTSKIIGYLAQYGKEDEEMELYQNIIWAWCPLCDRFGLGLDRHNYPFTCECFLTLCKLFIDQGWLNRCQYYPLKLCYGVKDRSDEIEKAYTAARQARFEHGERP